MSAHTAFVLAIDTLRTSVHDAADADYRAAALVAAHARCARSAEEAASDRLKQERAKHEEELAASAHRALPGTSGAEADGPHRAPSDAQQTTPAATLVLVGLRDGEMTALVRRGATLHRTVADAFADATSALCAAVDAQLGDLQLRPAQLVRAQAPQL